MLIPKLSITSRHTPPNSGPDGEPFLVHKEGTTWSHHWCMANVANKKQTNWYEINTYKAGGYYSCPFLVLCFLSWLRRLDFFLSHLHVALCFFWWFVHFCSLCVALHWCFLSWSLANLSSLVLGTQVYNYTKCIRTVIRHSYSSYADYFHSVTQLMQWHTSEHVQHVDSQVCRVVTLT